MPGYIAPKPGLWKQKKKKTVRFRGARLVQACIWPACRCSSDMQLRLHRRRQETGRGREGSGRGSVVARNDVPSHPWVDSTVFTGIPNYFRTPYVYMSIYLYVYNIPQHFTQLNPKQQKKSAFQPRFPNLTLPG